ncbi:DNA polymerase III subunit delta [Erysipelotrichaceae bacterium]|nr:DNA polymerase III subunit delta [Erysipelotrichaceae bacterium]
MLYILQGTEQYLLEKARDKIKNTADITAEDIIFFSAVDQTFEALFMEICTDNLFGGRKIIFVTDIANKNIDSYLAHFTKKTVAAIAHAHNVCVLEIASNTPFSKTFQASHHELLRVAQKMDVMPKDEKYVIEAIIMELKNTPHALVYEDYVMLAEKYKNNLGLIISEISRIKLEVCNNGRMVTKADFLAETFYLEEEVFNLITKIEGRDIKSSMKILDNILIQQQNVFGLLALLLKNYKQMYQIRSLEQGGYAQTKIAERLEIHPYRTRLLAKSAQRYSRSGFQHILAKILETEHKLKIGIAHDIAIKELFLLIFYQN